VALVGEGVELFARSLLGIAREAEKVFKLFEAR
jgi:hypothetical protein